MKISKFIYLKFKFLYLIFCITLIFFYINIKCNTNPYLGYHNNIMKEIVSNMLNDLFKITLDPFFPPPPQLNNNGKSNNYLFFFSIEFPKF